MKFLILNTDYYEFLSSLYATNPGLCEKSYNEQIRERYESLFGLADFYSSNLRKLGHEAWDIYFNNRLMQSKWAEENELKTSSDWQWQFRIRRGVIPWVSRIRGPRDQRWIYDILAAQIKHYNPDVILNQAIERISCSFLKELKPYYRLLVGKHAARTLSNTRDWNCYDIIISSFPPTVEHFRQSGVPIEFLRLGFEPHILKYLNKVEQKIPVSFIGSLFSDVHSSRLRWLKDLCSKLDIKVWMPNTEDLDIEPCISSSHVGQAWGKRMYETLHQSKITLNHHGDIPPYANNQRLFEATGVGTLLITDWKVNLHDMFEPGKEVVAYRNQEDCAELIEYYLEHDEEREFIASAGQRRTLQEHTNYQRMQELVDIIHKYI